MLGHVHTFSILIPFLHAGRDVDGSGFCRLLNTRSNNCWDGSENRTDDIDDFDDDDIIDQGALTEIYTHTHYV